MVNSLIFTALRRVSPYIYYFRTKSGSGVNFVTQLKDRPLLLVQVSESLADPKTRKREIMALGEAMAELGIRSGTTVTRNGEEEIVINRGKIKVVPAWHFLLNIPEL
jgi:predicted AAA+ superfamily ATPase